LLNASRLMPRSTQTKHTPQGAVTSEPKYFSPHGAPMRALLMGKASGSQRNAERRAKWGQQPSDREQIKFGRFPWSPRVVMMLWKSFASWDIILWRHIAICTIAQLSQTCLHAQHHINMRCSNIMPFIGVFGQVEKKNDLTVYLDRPLSQAEVHQPWPSLSQEHPRAAISHGTLHRTHAVGPIPR